MSPDQHPPTSNGFEDAEAEKLRVLWSGTSGWTIPSVNTPPPLPADDLDWLKDHTADMLRRQLENAETTNHLLRAALDSVRRDLAELKAQAATAPAPAPEPAAIAPVTRKEVLTLVQEIVRPADWESADARYAQLLNEGWVKDHMVVSLNEYDGRQLYNRTIVLVREVSEPAAGDAPAAKAEASAPATKTVTAVGPTIVIEPLGAPSLDEAFAIPIIHNVREHGAGAVIEARNEDLYEAFRSAYARAPRAVRPALLPAGVK